MFSIVFKTKDELAFVPEGSLSPGEFLLRKNVLTGIEKLGKDFSSVKSLFPSINRSQAGQLVQKARANNPGYSIPDLFSYYFIECDFDDDNEKTIEVLRNNSSIEFAYLERNSSIVPHFHTKAKPLGCYQGYLADAPLGIGAGYAWEKKGGSGDGTVKFVDVEKGWLFDHESLDFEKTPDSGFINEAFGDHGVAVMGIIMMKDGGSGAKGITPMVKGSVMSVYRGDGKLNTPDAIVSALTYLDAGDILLLETQVVNPEDSYRLWPLEIREANFDMIRLATALGITVIEPAGNGNIYSSSGNDLNEFTDYMGRKILNRHHRDFKDSGAIMVAAATSEVPHNRMHFTNYGNRVDCYSWGENILTAGLHPRSSGMANNTYTYQFGGTSGAAAIIAGAAISLQGMIEANFQRRLNPLQMRAILGDPEYGTSAEGEIGVMLDLEKIIKDYIR